MRMRQTIAFLVMVLAALPAQAQEIRGNINGIVQDKGGVIPGAAVTVRNADTGQTQPLVTNGGATSKLSFSIRAPIRFMSN